MLKTLKYDNNISFLMKTLCLIPARYNSKRLPFKNFLKINNKFLFERTFSLALKIKEFDEILFSSDYNKISKFKKKYPKIFFQKRPKKISNDRTKMSEVISYTLKEFKTIGKKFDAVVILQPTSPLRKKKTVEEAIKIFKKCKPDYLASITKLKHTINPKKIFKLPNKKFIKRINFNLGKNELNDEFYGLDGGVVFIFKTSNKKYKLNGKGAFIKVKFPENIDIDYKEDFLLVKKFLK